MDRTPAYDECMKALTCLYLACEPKIADDVNAKVKAAIDDAKKGERERIARIECPHCFEGSEYFEQASYFDGKVYRHRSVRRPESPGIRCYASDIRTLQPEDVWSGDTP